MLTVSTPGSPERADFLPFPCQNKYCIPGVLRGLDRMGNPHKIEIMSKAIVRLDSTLSLTGLRRWEFREYGGKMRLFKGIEEGIRKQVLKGVGEKGREG